ncbi:ArnT family glycosyltransferase [Candidatus Dependentiae bacterium]
MKYKKNLFSLIFFFCSIILYLNVPSYNSHKDIDSSAYTSNALRFKQANSFINTSNFNDIPYYSLGYAFFIGLVYKVFGVKDFFIIWIQFLLALVTGFLIFRITKNIFGKTVGLISFFLFSINLGFLVFTQFILTEILLVFLLTFFVDQFVFFINNQKFINLMLSALFLGISIAVKPAALYFIFLLIPLIFFFSKKRKFFTEFDWRIGLKNIFIFSLFFYLPVIGYMCFNKSTFNQFRVGGLANENLYLYFFPKVLAKQNQTNIKKETQYLSSLLTGNKLENNSWAKIQSLFFKKLKKNPFIFIKVWLTNVTKTFLGLYTTNLKVLLEVTTRGGDVSFFKTRGSLFFRIKDYISEGTNSLIIKIIGFLEFIYSFLRYIFCLIAILFLIFKKKWNWISFFILYIFYFSFITGHDGCARFRMMFESVLIILTAEGIFLCFGYRKIMGK